MMWIASLIHRSILLLSLSDYLGAMMLFRDGMHVTALFCSAAADILVLRVYVFTSRCVTSYRCSCSHTPKALPVSPMQILSQFSHGILYTHSQPFCCLSLSFGCTSRLVHLLGCFHLSLDIVGICNVWAPFGYIAPPETITVNKKSARTSKGQLKTTSSLWMCVQIPCKNCNRI